MNIVRGSFVKELVFIFARYQIKSFLVTYFKVLYVIF